MKIAIFNWQCWMNPHSGGAEVHMREIFSRIAHRGHSVTLFCCSFEGAPERETQCGIEIIRHGARPTFNYGVRGLYRRYVEGRGFDVVVDDINKIPFYTPRFVREPLLAVSHHFFGTSIFREAGLISGLYVWLAEQLVNAVYKKTPFAVVSNSTLEEFMERGFARSMFTLVYNGIEPSEYPMRVLPKASRRRITYFGRLKKYKRVDHVLVAASALVDVFPDLEVHLMGRGDFEPELRALAQTLGLAERTVFHGYVNDADKVRLLAESHVVVNPSKKEGWGITNIEANACGTPVISADVPGLRDSVSEGVSGRLYRDGDTDHLAAILREVLSDGTALDVLSAGAVEWAGGFTWGHSAEVMEELLGRVINGRREG